MAAVAATLTRRRACGYEWSTRQLTAWMLTEDAHPRDVRGLRRHRCDRQAGHIKAHRCEVCGAASMPKSLRSPVPARLEQGADSARAQVDSKT